MNKIRLTFLLFTIFFVSCRQEKPDVHFLDQKISTSSKIEKLLAPEIASELGIDPKGRELLYAFYSERKFKPLWSKKAGLTDKGEVLEKMLKAPILFGLPAKRFSDLKWDDKYHLKNELIISCMLSRMHMDLRYGVIDSMQMKPIAHTPKQFLEQVFDFPSGKEKIAEKIMLWGPEDSTYQALARGLFQFASSHPLNDEKIAVPTQKKDSSTAVQQARKALIARGYLKNDPSDDEYLSALKSFQTLNGQQPDGVIGVNTANALEETNLHKCKRTALALEKWRWKKPFPKQYIRVNIPEYKLRLVLNDSLKSENNVVVGKFENQTPEFNAKLRAVVVYPYWNVPYSISSKEILPDARKNPYYFEKNRMKLLRKGEEVDPLTVNWKGISEKSFPYAVRQEPGPNNSLGIIKFEFNNPYGVYIHDTPSKTLFKTTVRSYSHGCVRCEHPVDLAKIILEYDENKMTPDSLDTLIGRQTNHMISLRKTIPIYFDYISVIPDRKDGLIFLRDIYLKDEEFLKVMF